MTSRVRLRLDRHGVAPGSEITFSLDGSTIVITPVGTSVKDDWRVELKAAAARVRASFSAEFKQLGADEIMNFIRGDGPAKDTPGATGAKSVDSTKKRGRR